VKIIIIVIIIIITVIIQVQTWQFFSIGTVTDYSVKYSVLVAYKILDLFQY